MCGRFTITVSLEELTLSHRSKDKPISYPLIDVEFISYKGKNCLKPPTLRKNCYITYDDHRSNFFN